MVEKDVTDTTIESVSGMVTASGIHGRQLRELIALLAYGTPQPLAVLIRESALPRRSVEFLLQTAEPDLQRLDGTVQLRPEVRDSYIARFRLDAVRRTPTADPVSATPDLLARISRYISAGPAGQRDLDHVAATAETVVRRALWLNRTYHLGGARLLCAGDHDLTSLAVAAVNPDVAITVVDLDERILEFIAAQAGADGYDIRCLFADFRLGIPATADGWADLVVTDPPYTPEGVRLFLGRGLQTLRDRKNGRLVMAYGYSPREPELGRKVQEAIQDLSLVFEAILPNFNRYHGAQAVGSASDLYVLQPTARTWKTYERQLARTRTNIYTHGTRSLEGEQNLVDVSLSEAVRDAASGPDALPISVAIADGAVPAAHEVDLAMLMASGLPASFQQRPMVVTANLAADPGSWLLRALLAVNADRVAVLLPNNHADLVSESAQRDVTNLVRAKYSLRFRRSTPDGEHAIVEATSVDPGTPADGAWLVRQILDRAHGRIDNVWREGLVRLSQSGPHSTLSKNEARAVIRDAAKGLGALDSRLIDLPRHAIPELLAAVAASAELLIS